MSRRTDLLFHQNSFGSHVLPNGLVAEGKSTNARLQSSTFDGSASFVAVPLTTTRLSVDEKIGRFTMPVSVSLASEAKTLALSGESVTTLFNVITSGNCGRLKPPVLASKPCSFAADAP